MVVVVTATAVEVVVTSVECNLAKGRTAHFSPLMALNAFIHWAGTFTRGCRQTMQNALVCKKVTMGPHISPSKLPLPMDEIWIHIIYGSLGSRMFCCFHTAHLCAKHTDRHTDHATCDNRSSRPHLCTACRLTVTTIRDMCLQQTDCYLTCQMIVSQKCSHWMRYWHCRWR